MVSSGYSDVGEEWAQKFAFRQDTVTRDTTVEILLFNDATDVTDDTSDVGDITTEPTDGNYTRQTFDLDSSDVTLSIEAGDLRATAEVTFDVDGTTGTVDASGCVVDFQSDVVNAETGANPHLIYSGLLQDSDGNPFTSDLSQFTSLTTTVQLDLE